MVDLARRREMAELLRHFAAGLLTVEDWESRSYRLSKTADSALREIDEILLELFDNIDSTLLGKWHPQGEARHLVARSILFLYSESEYRWADGTGAGYLFNLLTFGLWDRIRTRESDGDERCWPFFSIDDLEEAKQEPRFFVKTVA